MEEKIYFYGDMAGSPCKCTKEQQETKPCEYLPYCAEQTIKDQIRAKETARAESELIKKFIKSKGLYDELLRFALAEAVK